MNNLMKAEWFKLKRELSFWFVLMVLLLFALISPAEIYDHGIDVDKAFYFNAIVSVNMDFLLIVSPILAGFFVTSDYSRGTMKNMVASGNGRTRIYLAKLGILTLAVMTFSLILPIVLPGATAVYYGFNSFPSPNILLADLGLTLLYAGAFASIMMLFAMLFTNSAVTVVFLIFAFMLSDEISRRITESIPVLEPLLDYSVFQLATEIGTVTEMDPTDALKYIFVPIAVIIAMTALGSWLFSKKEIK